MSETHKIGRVALYVEVAGQAALVTMSQDKLRELVYFAASMCEGGVLPVMKQPDTEFTVKAPRNWTVPEPSLEKTT